MAFLWYSNSQTPFPVCDSLLLLNPGKFLMPIPYSSTQHPASDILSLHSPWMPFSPAWIPLFCNQLPVCVDTNSDFKTPDQASAAESLCFPRPWTPFPTCPGSNTVPIISTSKLCRHSSHSTLHTGLTPSWTFFWLSSGFIALFGCRAPWVHTAQALIHLHSCSSPH